MSMMSYLKYEIFWGLLILLLFRVFLQDEQMFFITTALYFGIWVLRRLKIYIPKIVGLKLYTIFILYASLIGFVLYNTRNVIRDLFYIVPTVLWIVIGYNFSCENVYTAGEKSLLKTIYIYGAIISLKCLLEFIVKRTFEFNQIRIIFGTYVYDIGLILPILAFELFIVRKTIFSSKIDKLIFFLMLIQIGLSFGRIAILEPLLAFAMISILSVIGLNYKGRTLKTLAIIVAVLTITVVGLFFILPDSTTITFWAKIENSVTEINTNQNIDSVTSAMQNWRAYEIQAALKQWKNSSILIQIFGYGMGKGIKVDYVPYNWENAGMVVNGEMPLAHNGFYTLLPKGGLFAIIAMVAIFVGGFTRGFKIVKHEKEKGNGIILVGIMAAGLANMWVVRGPVGSEAFVIWGILLGWIYAK